MKNFKKMIRTLKNTRGFTMMEFVVTISIMGILLSVAIPSYSNVRLEIQERQTITNMNIIREAFFQYFYRMHMKGDPHFPVAPKNSSSLMDSEWVSMPMDSSMSPTTPKELFSNGRVPTNLNSFPFMYEAWNDTIPSTGEIVYYMKISDVDEDSPAYEKSFTHAI